MKANVFLIAIAVIMAGLFSYLVYCLAGDADSSSTFGIGSAVGFIATLVPLIGLKHERHRTGVNLNVLSVMFFALLLVCNVCFALFCGPVPYFIICNGIMILIYFTAFYKISRLEQ